MNVRCFAAHRLMHQAVDKADYRGLTGKVLQTVNVAEVINRRVKVISCEAGAFLPV
ncbi:MAG: hypothetical protein L3J50_10665 [Emcibacter sp.]|nr:hypothetical protein [Emcibacter sp.]